MDSKVTPKLASPPPTPHTHRRKGETCAAQGWWHKQHSSRSCVSLLCLQLSGAMVKPGPAQTVSSVLWTLQLFNLLLLLCGSSKSQVRSAQNAMPTCVDMDNGKCGSYPQPSSLCAQVLDGLEMSCLVTFPPSTPAWTTFCSDETAGAKMMLTLLLPCSKNPQWFPRGSSITSKFIVLHSSAQLMVSNTATVTAQQIPAKVYWLFC